MRTLWLLEEMGLDFDLVLHRFDRELQSDEYLAISGAGRVPALEHDGLCLIETGAITEYLCETFPTPLFRAPGDPERAMWLQWLHFAETIGQHLAVLTQQHIVLFPEARSVGVMKLERRRLEKTLSVIDQVLDGQDYLLASGFSAIDTNVGYAVHIARHFTPLREFANVSGYYDRLHARPAFQAALPGADADLLYERDFYDIPAGN